MLVQRLKLVHDTLGCTNTALAEYADCSPSHISKILSGKRVLQEGGKGALHFAKSLLLYAEHNGNVDGLCALCGLSSAEMSVQRLSAWLYGEGCVSDIELPDAENEKKERMRFSGRFDRLMSLLDLSNVRLSKLMSVDASLISRFRTGKRSPRKNAQFSHFLCEILLERMRQIGVEKDVANMLGCTEKMLSSDAAVQILMTWLFDKTDEKKAETRTFDYLKMFLPLTQLPVEEVLEGLKQHVESEKADTYWGIDGMRNAVLRLLVEAAIEGSGEVYMYADQSMQWLLADREVLNVWYLCCALCVSRDVHLIVIHDINRNVDEMANALQVWVPLFVTGKVEPYYCTLNRGSRFTHMLFLRPGAAAVSSLHVYGASNNNFYDYIQDSKKLNALHSEFKALLANSEKLVQTYTHDNMQKYYSILAQAMAQTEKSFALLDAPACVTLPDDVLEKMLLRSNMTEEDKEIILSMRRYTLDNLKSGGIFEMFELPPMQDVLDGELYLCFGSSLLHGGPRYTPEEYRQHIERIIHLCQTQPQYRCCILSKAPFPRMRMIIGKNCTVLIRLHKPYTAFVVENEYFTKAFAVLFYDFYEQNRIPPEQTVEILKKYLTD